MRRPPRKMSAGERVTARDYNELLDYARGGYPLAGHGVTITHTRGGSMISSKPGQDDGKSELKPWTVRLDEGGFLYKIYIPRGCVALDGCVCVNYTQQDVEGNDIPDWYILFDLTSPNPAQEKTYVVRVHIKGRTRLGDETQDHACVMACLEDEIPSEEKRNEACVGDVHAFEVALCIEKEKTDYVMGESPVTHKIRQLFDEPVLIQLEAEKQLELFWKGRLRSSTFVPFISKGEVVVGGSIVITGNMRTNDDRVEIGTAGQLYFILTCTGNNTFSYEFKFEKSTDVASISLPIYAFNDKGGMTHDLRHVLDQAVFYP